MSVRPRRARLVVPFLGLAFVFAAAEARGAEVSFQATIPLSPYLNGGSHSYPAASLPKFDLAGHCLESVCVRLDGATDGLVGYENFQPTPMAVGVTFLGQITLQRPDASTIVLVQPLTNVNDNLPAFDGNADYDGPSGRMYPTVGAAAVDSVCLAGAPDLALFSGAGSIALPTVGQDLSTVFGAGSWTIGLRTYGTITVRYTYRECSTPTEVFTWGRIKNRYR